jgi:tRNA-splicing ligase RtcB
MPSEWQLDYLPLDSDEGRAYTAEMEYCVNFAFSNRKLMLSVILEEYKKLVKGAQFSEIINIAHNYAALEKHFGREVMVHRKGATRAFKGMTGIIPGSQGSKSYIVTGKGNPDSFMSCSHGAGRRMGRKQAIRELNLDNEIKKLNQLGIVHSLRSNRDLDEASGAYKDINLVMKQQEDLAEIKIELTPLGVIKG